MWGQIDPQVHSSQEPKGSNDADSNAGRVPDVGKTEIRRLWINIAAIIKNHTAQPADDGNPEFFIENENGISAKRIIGERAYGSNFIKLKASKGVFSSGKVAFAAEQGSLIKSTRQSDSHSGGPCHAGNRTVVIKLGVALDKRIIRAQSFRRPLEVRGQEVAVLCVERIIPGLPYESTQQAGNIVVKIDFVLIDRVKNRGVGSCKFDAVHEDKVGRERRPLLKAESGSDQKREWGIGSFPRCHEHPVPIPMEKVRREIQEAINLIVGTRLAENAGSARGSEHVEIS